MKCKISPRRTFLLAHLVALCVTLGLAGAVRADQGPMETTQSLVNAALKVIANKSIPVAQRGEQVRQLIEPEFDFTEMSRSALGYHWKSLSPNQRGEFTQVFTRFIEAAYASKIGDYSGQRVDFVKESPLGDGYAQVFTNIVQAGKDPVPLNYLLERRNGTWKIYDVTVDNISIVANYRTQFDRVINEDGFDKLLADLKAKQQQLRQAQAG
jgi:phospholipid transport system substrate-binding protein